MELYVIFGELGWFGYSARLCRNYQPPVCKLQYCILEVSSYYSGTLLLLYCIVDVSLEKDIPNQKTNLNPIKSTIIEAWNEALGYPVAVYVMVSYDSSTWSFQIPFGISEFNRVMLSEQANSISKINMILWISIERGQYNVTW